MADKKSKQAQSLTQAQIRYAMKRIDEIIQTKIKALGNAYSDSEYMKEKRYKQYLGKLMDSGKEIKFLKEAFSQIVKTGRVENLDIWDYIKISGAKSFVEFKQEYKDGAQQVKDKEEMLRKVATELKDKLMLSPSTFVLDELSKLESFEL